VEVRWRRSTSLGLHWAGWLAAGVHLPAEGPTFFTWDPIRRRSPNRASRRWGNDRLVRTLLDVLEAFAAAHPEAPRIGVGDLSRPSGGDFGPRYGLPGHVSHQNGLDADLYYPRLDRRERAPDRPAQIDRRLAQELVNRFVAAGAVRVFVGPSTGLRGPPGVVQALAHHDNHLHVRLPLDARRQRPRPFRAAEPRSVSTLGRTARGRRVRAFRLGNPAGRRRVLVVGCIHGTECAGMAIARRLIAVRPPLAADLWVVQNLNPDGLALGVRQNARGVDLNRNFGSEWRRIGIRWDPQHSGPRPFSEPETRMARDLILRLRPRVTIWFHQPQALVRAWGPSIPAARRYARLAGMQFRALRWPAGTGPNWQNHRFPGTSSFVVELPAGPLAPASAERHVRAILAFTR
jgi:hypothetical protein